MATTVIFTLNAGNADFPYLASDYHIADHADQSTASRIGSPACAPAPSSW